MTEIRVIPHLHLEEIDFQSQAARRAIMRAGSDALDAAQAAAVRFVRERRNIRAKDIRKALSLRYPPRGVEATEVSWFLRVASQPLPIAAYPYSQTRQGITARIKAGSLSRIRHAFEATVAAGATGTHTGVFMRYGPYRPATRGRYAGKKRQAIRELFTTRVLDVFRDPDFLDVVGSRAKAVFRSTFLRNYFGSGRGR